MKWPVASASSSRPLLLAVAALVAPWAIGCGATGAATTRTTTSVAVVGSVAEEPAPSVHESRVSELESESARRDRRIRELESRLAMADAEVRDLRHQADSREVEAQARPVVRIGDAPRARVEPVEDPTEFAEEIAHDDGPRPVLRLYGPPPMPPMAAYAAPTLPGPGIAAMPAAVVPQYLPAAPVGGLGPLPVVAPPGMRSMVPPIPDRPLTVLPPAPAPVIAANPASAATTGATRTSEDPAVRQYQAALGHVAGRRFDEALVGLTAFLGTYPQHPYADNAMYWRGEVLYMRRDFAGAERELTEMVRRFPRGNKVADALLRLGFCRQRQGDLEGARAYFRRVRTEHPGTVAARLAAREDT